MSFIDSIKNFFNIGGVKIKLQVAPSFKKSSKLIEGSVILTSKAPKHVTGIEIDLTETWQTGRGEEKTTKDYKWGEITINEEFDIKPGEEKVMSFSLPFAPVLSNNEDLAKKGGMLGGLGKIAMFAEASKSSFKVTASVNVTGTALGPNDIQEIKAED